MRVAEGFSLGRMLGQNHQGHQSSNTETANNANFDFALNHVFLPFPKLFNLLSFNHSLPTTHFCDFFCFLEMPPNSNPAKKRKPENAGSPPVSKKARHPGHSEDASRVTQHGILYLNVLFYF